MSSECNLETCEAHLYMSEGLKDLKNISMDLTRGQQVIEKSIIKLTENFNEMQRMNVRLESIVVSQNKKDEEQDLELKNQRDFMNKALGVLGALTFLVPTIISILAILFKN